MSEIKGISAKIEAVTISYSVLEAKDREIDRLRAEVEQLREALEKLADYDVVIGGVIYAHKEPEFIARLKQARALLASTAPKTDGGFFCGNCDGPIEDTGWKYCPWCRAGADWQHRSTAPKTEEA